MTRFPSGARVELFELLDSTSLEAKRRAASGEGGPLWVIAKAQTSGYGRRGRAWQQQVGDFAGTLIFKPSGDPTKFGQLSFIAALAVFDAIEKLISHGDLSLKWPNDVLLDGAKTAGILLEFSDAPNGPVIALGVGVNIVNSPSEMAYPTARILDFAGSSGIIDISALGAAIDRHFWAHELIWRQQGFEPIRKLWLERAKGIGDEIEVRLPNEQLRGVFYGLDPTGALQLRLDNETRIINAGDVFFGAPPNG